MECPLEREMTAAYTGGWSRESEVLGPELRIGGAENVTTSQERLTLDRVKCWALERRMRFARLETISQLSQFWSHWKHDPTFGDLWTAAVTQALTPLLDELAAQGLAAPEPPFWGDKNAPWMLSPQ